jgi:16S rRNA (cytosine967-C5)-methyltransferase
MVDAARAVGLSADAAAAAAAHRDTPGLAARRAAARLLSDVLDRGRSLDALLDGPGSPLAPLVPRDRALARAILGTALRRHGAIDGVLRALIARPPGRAGPLMRILEVAAAQLLFMEVADHAAVSLAMAEIAADRLAMHYKALANAVLRRIARERDSLLANIDPVVDTPAWLYERWSRNYGEETARRIAEAHRSEAPLDLSVKSDAAGWAGKLGGTVLPTGTVRLVAPGPVEALPGFGDGAWWVQDAAAALPARLLGNVAGKRVADLCAAPGGKTAELVVAGASVVAVDIAPERIARLRATLDRLDLTAEVVKADVLVWRPQERFDAVLLDAPCSATGTIRRHPDIPYLKRAADMANLAALQSQMIERAVDLLKPGGTLVYATCSLEPEEGEAHVAATLARLPVALLQVAPAELPGLEEAIRDDGTVRTMPFHLPSPAPGHGGLDAFFVMRLKKL